MARIKLKLITFIAILGMSGCSTISQPNDDICSKLNNFIETPFRNGASQRSITLSWSGNWMDFENGYGKACLFPNEDIASKSLCEWLPDNTSTEFPKSVPMRIMKCYGYDFPSYSTWSNWQSSIDLWGNRESPLLLEVDLKDVPSNKNPSIRLTVFAKGHGDYDDDFIPLVK